MLMPLAVRRLLADFFFFLVCFSTKKTEVIAPTNRNTVHIFLAKN